MKMWSWCTTKGDIRRWSRASSLDGTPRFHNRRRIESSFGGNCHIPPQKKKRKLKKEKWRWCTNYTVNCNTAPPFPYLGSIFLIQVGVNLLTLPPNCCVAGNGATRIVLINFDCIALLWTHPVSRSAAISAQYRSRDIDQRLSGTALLRPIPRSAGQLRGVESLRDHHQGYDRPGSQRIGNGCRCGLLHDLPQASAHPLF